MPMDSAASEAKQEPGACADHGLARGDPLERASWVKKMPSPMGTTGFDLKTLKP